MSSTLNLEILRGITFGPVEIICKDADGVPVPMAGWKASAQASRKPGEPVVIDFSPVIQPDDGDGLITLSEMSWIDTLVLAVGDLTWDLVLIDPVNRHLPPVLHGKCKVMDINTSNFPNTGGQPPRQPL